MISRARVSRTFQRPRKRRQVKAVILDMSGTTIDPFVLAPALAFVKVFQHHHIPISIQEARIPMGLRKDFHIAAILKQPKVARRFLEIMGFPPDQSTVDKIYKNFIPTQLSILQKQAELIPDVASSLDILRSLRCRIGGTTGFTREMANVCLGEMAKQGVEFDCFVAGDDLPKDAGTRPKPFMLYENMLRLNVPDVATVVKVDDTTVGIAEGLNARAWTVGIAGASNYMDIDSLEQWRDMSPEERLKRLEHSRSILKVSHPHYLIDSFAELPGVIMDINTRMETGETPC